MNCCRRWRVDAFGPEVGAGGRHSRGGVAVGPIKDGDGVGRGVQLRVADRLIVVGVRRQI